MDNDIKDLLDAIGRRDLEWNLSDEEIQSLRSGIKTMSATARLAHTIGDRPNRIEMYRPLADELDSLTNDSTFCILSRTGVDSVIDEHGEIVIPQLSPDDLPHEDLDFLRNCGIKNPADEVTITFTYLRRIGLRLRNAPPNDQLKTAEIMDNSKTAIQNSARELRTAADTYDDFLRNTIRLPDPVEQLQKPKKFFIGVGGILTGTATAAGNVLIGAGIIPATVGTGAAGAIASAILGVGMIMQGIGDLNLTSK